MRIPRGGIKSWTSRYAAATRLVRGQLVPDWQSSLTTLPYKRRSRIGGATLSVMAYTKAQGSPGLSLYRRLGRLANSRTSQRKSGWNQFRDIHYHFGRVGKGKGVFGGLGAFKGAGKGWRRLLKGRR